MANELPALLEDVKAQSELLQAELEQAGDAIGLIKKASESVEGTSTRLTTLTNSVETLATQLQGIAPQDIVGRLGSIESDMTALKAELSQAKLMILGGLVVVAILQFVAT